MLQKIFIDLVQKYSTDNLLAEKLWFEIERNYSASNRHYHTLIHLENLYAELVYAKSKIEDLDTVLFALYYHDIIYDVLSIDNEERSASLANEKLMLISYPEQKIGKCHKHIMATKAHTTSINMDTNYFIDADLSILGTNNESYFNYVRQIRAEYSIYPDSVYIPGRRAVITHFIQMKRIYKTELFFDKFELQARQNLINELNTLV